MAGILAIEYALPQCILTNDELERLFKSWTAEKIYKKTGIMTRHIADKNETAVDLAEQAACKLFDRGTIEKEDVDFLILVTQSADYVLPSSACILQERLGLKKTIGALDINLGCSGYIYGLMVANSLVQSSVAKNVLLITSDTYSKYIHPLDRSTRTIFGDGAAATLVAEGGYEIGAFDFGTDGKGGNLFMIPAGGLRYPEANDVTDEMILEADIPSLEKIHMDGTGIFEFTIREVPDSVNNLLMKEGMNKEDVDLYVFHQANEFMLDFLRRNMDIDKDKFYMNFSDIGNTVSSSIPIALKRAMEEKKMLGKQNIVISGFGVGLSWGTTILKKR